jgi:L-ornithine Nalpha-acyltransferase
MSNPSDLADRPTGFAARLLGGLQKGSAILAPHVGRATPLPSPAGLDGVLGRIGSLEVRLAQTAKDVKRAQKLRYRVFYDEMAAVPDLRSRLKRRDIDAYDAICDHLLVIDHDAPSAIVGASGPGARKPKVVGTYRLLRQEIAERHAGFYSAGEFEIQPLLDAHPGKRFLELGRSCVLQPYRDKRTVELLWHGVWTYVRRHGMDVMFGCASLEGVDPARLALPLSFLHHHAQAPAEWRASATRSRRVDMNMLAAADINPKAALHSLPPLIKGYLRVGARFGDGAVVDRQFGTTDVLVVLPVSAIHSRYIEHFGADATRHAG